jgi:tetratricopeptide (TPR) repeat protein
MGSSSYRKVLNVKLAIGFPIAVVVLAASVYLVHALQMKHTADMMLRNATEAEERGKPAEALEFYQYYIRYNPQDAPVYSKLALLLADEGGKAGSSRQMRLRAFDALTKASAQDAENMEVLRQLADYCIQMGLAQDATRHLERLRQQYPDESALGVKLARCQIQTQNYREARATLENVIAQDKSNVDAYAGLANLLHDRMDDPDRADTVLAQMIVANPKSPEAYVARARYHQAHKAADKARADIQKAEELSPKNLAVLLTAADLAMQGGKSAQAKEYLDRALSSYPDDEQVYEARAMWAQNAGKVQTAIDEREKIKNPHALLSLIALQLQKRDVPAVRETIKKMRKAGYAEPILDFFEGQALVAESQWRKASYALERVRPDLMRYGPLLQQLDLSLGDCYERLGLPDRQIVVYQRLLDRDPGLVPARLGYAAALLRSGQVERAIIESRKVRSKQDLETCLKNPKLRGILLQMMIAQVMRVPQDQRDWTEVDDFVERLSALEGVDPVQLVLIRASVLVKKGKVKDARALVQAACEKNPNQVGLWNAQINLVALDEGPQKALALAEEDKERLGAGLNPWMIRVGLAMQIGGQQGKEILDALAADGEKSAEAEKPEYWEKLGSAYYTLGDRKKAKQLWTQAAASGTGEARIQLALFELARETADKAGMVEATDALKESLGARSAEWNYCEASRLVWLIQNRQMDSKSLARAKQFLQEAAHARPNWQKALRLEGEVALMEGRVDDAIHAYQQASDAGQLSPRYVNQLVQLLYSKGRYDEAKQELDKLGDQRISPVLDRIRVELDERTGQLDQALQLAAQTVADSKRATDFLWYGQLLARAKKPEEAERALRRAIELEPRIPESWLALVGLLVQQGKKAEAEQVVRDAQTQLPQDRTPVLLAQCYEMLGQIDRAEQQYLAAVSLAPDNLGTVRRVAVFYLQHNLLDKAAKHLSDMLQLAGLDAEKHREDLVWARRQLARVMAASGDYRRHQQALKLLDLNARAGQPEAVDVRLKAEILAKRPERESRSMAITLLEGLQQRLQQNNASLSVEEQFVLAQLYERTNRWSDCQREMLDLLGRSGKEVRFMAAYIEMLMRHGGTVRDIKPWVTKLEALQPRSPLTIGMKARLLAKSGQGDEAVRLARTLIPDPLPPEQIGVLRDVSGLLEELEQYGPAREVLTEFAKKAPAGVGNLYLAAFFGRRGSIDEALQQCQTAIEALSAEAVLPVAVAMLSDRKTKATPQQIRKVEEWIQRALDENPHSKTAQLEKARLLDMQGKYDEVIKAYRSYLTRDDLTDEEKAPVWNNLAFVLAAAGRDGKEALEMVTRAIAVMGPVPSLLDTQGMAYLATGQNTAATEALRVAIGDSPTGLRYFHLALAHAAANNLEAAAKAMETGRDSYRLSPDQIPEMEREKYKKLMRAIESL